MRLKEIYDYMTTGELHHLFLAEERDSSGDLTDAAAKRLWPSVRMGLTELHRRFHINEGTVYLDMVAGQTTYFITLDYAQSNTKSTQAIKYIDDTAAPFQDDLMQIHRVYDAKGKELILNNLSDKESLHTPNEFTLCVPDELMTQRLKIVYRADHAAVNSYVAVGAPIAVSIALPAVYIQALCFYVASRIMNPIGPGIEAFHEGNNYAQRFEGECQRLSMDGIQVQREPDRSDVAFNNGWV